MITNSAKVLSENTTIVQANQFPIKTVKLFQSSSGAEITRTFPLSFLRSQNEPQAVEIVHLPAGIQSVDVSVTSSSGSVTILDHFHTSAARGQNVPLSSQTLRELETERLRLEDEKRLRQQSFTFLTTYMDSLAQCKSQNQTEAAQMVNFFDEFVDIGVTRSATIAELDGKLADLGSKITEETERLTKLSNDLPVKVVAVLSCNSEAPVEAAELAMTYVVKQVSWKSAYDLHISMAGNTPSPTATLDFRCTVTQWTGENWENISLSLTTADRVSQLIQLPEPKKVNISLTSFFPNQPANATQFSVFGQLQQRPFPEAIERDREREVRTPTLHAFGQSAQTHTTLFSAPRAQPAPAPPAFGRLMRRQPSSDAMDRPERHAYENSQVDVPVPRPQTPVVIEIPEVDAPSQTVSHLISHDGKDPITHIASGSIFIPSDHAAHHVLVASLSLQAEFMRVVVPSVDTRVYYTCEVKNTSEYVLLPGIVKAYLNDKHVSSTEIHNTELPQILECSLAVDTSVKAMHNRAPDALPSVAAFTGKAMTTYTSATVLHNLHGEPIRGVIVRSSIPLPADPRITIVLKEPAGLADIDEGSVTVKEGCIARWSTTGGRKGKQGGLFEWVCDMNPGTEVLKAVWEVGAPQGLKLLEQVHS